MDINSFVIGYKKGKSSAPAVETQEKDITIKENGTTEVLPDDGKLLSKVTVNTEVASGGGGGGMEGFHKVQFFNDDRTTLLYTVFVPHGASAMYAGDTPVSTENESGILLGFEPAPTNITADFDTYAVYEFVGTLDETSWERIAELSADGTAQNYFAVGDTKMIHIQGTVGTLSVNGDYGVYIIGFDHNKDLEGDGITFGSFKTASNGGIDVALCDSKYGGGGSDGTKYFNMNHWGNYNYGGWAASDLRYDVLGSTDVAPFGYGAAKKTSVVGYDATVTCATNPVENTLMAALPSDLRAVMKPMTTFADSKGGSSNVKENVTASIDYLPLLSEFEVFGTRRGANQYEQDKQAQYAYFAAGNSKVKYNHSSTGSSVIWWERSAYFGSNSRHCNVSADGNADYNSTTPSNGLAPIFKV